MAFYYNELTSILTTNQLTNPPQYTAKFFSTYATGASFYAQQDYIARGIGPYILVKTNIPT